MQHSKANRRGGNALIEFCLLGIPLIFVTVSIAAMGLNMWEYHNLAYATETTARYISMHGLNCTLNSNSCKMTISSSANYFVTQGLGLDPSIVNVTFTDSSGATNCNPLNTCIPNTGSNQNQFPSSGHNTVGSDITVTATYLLKNPIALYWPPDTDVSRDFTVGAVSKQRILF